MFVSIKDTLHHASWIPSAWSGAGQPPPGPVRSDFISEHLDTSTQGKGALLNWSSLRIANIFAEDIPDSFSINCYTVALAGT
jgi:hypothetical protein|mmetsp:Transcript_74926/g.165483  ORF Transcript_74926/g.165483 Transcript_74926/m.165483 type:complete len:82 (-) Transcript_74926:180-425(-)